MLQSTGTDTSTASICKLLLKNKKLALQQRSEELHVNFTAYEPEMLISVDETGSDKSPSLHAKKGQKAVAEKVLVRGKRHSVFSAMNIDGRFSH